MLITTYRSVAAALQAAKDVVDQHASREIEVLSLWFTSDCKVTVMPDFTITDKDYVWDESATSMGADNQACL